jgi:hypothetical protein
VIGCFVGLAVGHFHGRHDDGRRFDRGGHPRYEERHGDFAPPGFNIPPKDRQFPYGPPTTAPSSAAPGRSASGNPTPSSS